MLNMYETKTFSQIYTDIDVWMEDMNEAMGGLLVDVIDDEDALKTIYFLLYARYGNTPIINYSENIFKVKVQTNIFQKGPTWVRQLELQKSLRDLTDDELRLGAVQISNNALAPETEPSTTDTDELAYVNSQNVNKHKRSALDAYQFLQDLLKKDVTEWFVESFSNLFSKFVDHDIEHIYISEEEQEEE